MTVITHAVEWRIPGPRPAPVLGRTRHTLRLLADPIGYTTQLFQTYGPVAALSAGGGTRLYSPLPDCPGTVFAYGPDIVRQATTHHEVYYKYPLSGPLYPLGAVDARRAPLKHFAVGLFGVNSDEHRRHRRLLMPAFHKHAVEGYRDEMVALTEDLLARWQVGEQRDIGEDMRWLTQRVIAKTMFGEEDEHIVYGIGDLMARTFGQLGSLWTPLLPFDWPGLPRHRLLDSVHQLDRALRAIINRRRAASGGRRDMLALLLAARYEESDTPLTDDELIGHAGVIFAAGHDTSATALTWTLFLLAQHPQVAADLHAELDSVLHGDAPTVEQRQQLPLLDRVVKESMRVLPPVSWNGRVVAQPTELGGYALPAGTEVLVSIYHTHHMPDLFPQPETFDPRRWETIMPSVFEYNPFSAGPRMCIGASFAMLEIKIVLAMLLQRYRLACVPNLRVDRVGVIVLKPKQGMPMVVHRQDRQFTRGGGAVYGNIHELVALPGFDAARNATDPA